MRYTKSRDGKERASVRVTLRLTAEDLAAVKRQAKKDGHAWRVWVQLQASEGLAAGLSDGIDRDDEDDDDGRQLLGVATPADDQADGVNG